jgi:hypothetical protein
MAFIDSNIPQLKLSMLEKTDETKHSRSEVIPLSANAIVGQPNNHIVTKSVDISDIFLYKKFAE